MNLSRRVFGFLALLFFALLPAPSQAKAPTSQWKIKLIFSVDWEGNYLDDNNLAAITGFRDRHPEIKIIQFLNAAYFTKRGANAAEVKTAIDRRLRPDDELGLHIHGWKSLFTQAGLNFKSSPTFWGNDELNPSCDQDCGHEVPISAYSTEELRTVIRFSVNTLARQGYGRPTSFRSGGWLGTGSVLTALAAEGFKLDSSAVPANLLAERLENFPLYDWVFGLWPNITSLTQPYTIDTASGFITELPDTGGLADYVTSSQMLHVFKTVADDFARTSEQDRILQFGFHEETASTYIPELEKGLKSILAYAKRNEIPLEIGEPPSALTSRRVRQTNPSFQGKRK